MAQTKSAHTPGAWRASNAGIFAGADCIGMTGTDARPLAEEYANARLMAAAPELLAVLQEALDVNGGDVRFGPAEDEQSWCAVARALISKATGEA